MYFQLTGAIKNRIISELRRFWKYHPVYKDSLVDNIQGKFSFREQPQTGIIVKASGGSHTSLAADNYKGMIYSYVFLTKVKDKPGLSLEWIREDAVAIQQNGGVFPSAPGVYYLGIETENNKLVFYIDPLLDIYHEQVLMVDPSNGQLNRTPLAGTLRIYEMPSGFLYQENINYTLGGNGTLILNSPLTKNRWLQADYRYPEDSKGPFSLAPMFADNQAIPGVVLAFGNRVEAGDQLAVVVQDGRHPAALEYGGRWTLSVDCDVFARDIYAQEEIVDYSVTYLLGIARSRLSSEGLEIMSIGLGGESEEIYNDTGDDYFFNANFTLEIETEWSIHVPLAMWIRQALPLTDAEEKEIAGLPDEELTGKYGDVQMLESLNLVSVRDPFWSGKKGTLEVIR